MVNKWVKIACLVLMTAWASTVSADDGMRPSSSDEQGLTGHVGVWYVTIRNKEAQRSAGDFYGGLRGEQRMGICSMIFYQIPTLGDIADSAPFYIPDERMQLQKVNESSRNRFWEEIAAFAHDKDHFLDAWPQIRPLIRHTTLYASENDKALRASHEAHGYPQLGEAGEHLTVLSGIETIDVSPAGKRRFSGHIYHLYHPVVAADLQMLLNTGRHAEKRANIRRVKHQGVTYWRLDPKDL